MTGGSGHSSLFFGLVAVVVMLWPGVEARLDCDPDILFTRIRGQDWSREGERS